MLQSSPHRRSPIIERAVRSTTAHAEVGIQAQRRTARRCVRITMWSSATDHRRQCRAVADHRVEVARRGVLSRRSCRSPSRRPVTSPYTPRSSSNCDRFVEHDFVEVAMPAERSRASSGSRLCGRARRPRRPGPVGCAADSVSRVRELRLVGPHVPLWVCRRGRSVADTRASTSFTSASSCQLHVEVQHTTVPLTNTCSLNGASKARPVRPEVCLLRRKSPCFNRLVPMPSREVPDHP